MKMVSAKVYLYLSAKAFEKGTVNRKVDEDGIDKIYIPPKPKPHGKQTSCHAETHLARSPHMKSQTTGFTKREDLQLPRPLESQTEKCQTKDLL
ncbi:hypothetical protein AVEN_202111-1 [Araneus ventricosus]|uniref:Uncharacterized protein n=1 Tax=Araneus ventricosus TaxID=182803 RepID=A0A4Y1ZW72_ARAVE|nr:hypothetical protein AVEN_184908-1 [Araneus ventricosus]GBL71433.1 hypothetical protein AVEN_267904-1 [Araneus ventricosus]GBL71449.1 hypothetical protein AVEN_118293-1 [Araneus ventricosus]GBL71467.1 hypothetical protein AVEN_202111-1 [Araneus ventricosus]